jgi:hypothetical protein
MTIITILALALTLTGAPVASVVCAAFCHQAPVAHGHCYEDPAVSDGAVMKGEVGCTGAVLGDSPYLVTYRAAGAAVPVTTSATPTLNLTRTEAPVRRLPEVRSTLPPVVLRM